MGPTTSKKKVSLLQMTAKDNSPCQDYNDGDEGNRGTGGDADPPFDIGGFSGGPGGCPFGGGNHCSNVGIENARL
jgi:hypothetical protein